MYVPKVDDYVIWNSHTSTHEGWVYFAHSSYVTIEISVRSKSEENIQDCPIHKKTHTLLLCFSEDWNQLTYVKSRESRHGTLSQGLSDYVKVA